MDFENQKGNIMDLMWTGTDVLYMNEYPNVRFVFKVKIFFFRILVKIIDRFYSERNLVIANHLAHELHLRKPKFIYKPKLDLYLRPNKWTMANPENENWNKYVKGQLSTWYELERMKGGHA